MNPAPSRRDFLKSTLISVGGATAGMATQIPNRSLASETREAWNQGDLVHLLPVVSHEQLLIKVSLRHPHDEPLRLLVDSHEFVGTMTDTQRRFWQFHADGLTPGRTYELQLVDAAGDTLCDPWPLTMFPAPDQMPEHLRVLVYTCAGGNGDVKLPNGTSFFLSLAVRQRLLERALSFEPDVAIGIGDQVYWDLETGMGHPRLGELIRQFYDRYGQFNGDLPILGSTNEQILKRVVDPQLADLYGVRFRSTPIYLTQDDHDYFENDVATEEIVSFPPTPSMLRLARATQRLYFPEFLPDRSRPHGLGRTSPTDRAANTSESYGTLRYGRLMEMLMYDCRRFLSLKGPSAGFVTAAAERWLLQRTAAEGDARHLIHVPSTPFGWSAGKWGEWYPDVLQDDGSLGTSTLKPYWQSGWFAQHQRLLRAMHEQTRRIPFVVSGDLHAVGAGTIISSNKLDLSSNAITSILAGPIGTSGPGWPSAFRDTPPQTPSQLVVDEQLQPMEKNGFTLLDITSDKIVVRQFAWRPPEPIDDIDTLTPTVEFELKAAR